MNIKNILKYSLAFLAMSAMLTGCSDKPGNSDNSSGSNKPGNSNSGQLLTAATDRSGGNLAEVTPQKGDLIAAFEIEGHGTIKAVLFPEIAPAGVENFQLLCSSGFYKGLTIHRVMKGFMFQGGSTNGDGTGGDAMVNGGSFGIETAQNARHYYGALCYANAAGQNSTQFYIVNSSEPDDLDTFNKAAYENKIQSFEQMAAMAKDAGNEAYAEYYRFQAQYYQTTVNWYESATDEIKARYKEKGGASFLDGNYTVFGQVYEGFDVIESISNVEVVDNGSGDKTKPAKTITIKDVTVSLYE